MTPEDDYNQILIIDVDSISGTGDKCKGFMLFRGIGQLRYRTLDG